jgi:PAS domain S-box-containing protein
MLWHEDLEELGGHGVHNLPIPYDKRLEEQFQTTALDFGARGGVRARQIASKAESLPERIRTEPPTIRVTRVFRQCTRAWRSLRMASHPFGDFLVSFPYEYITMTRARPPGSREKAAGVLRDIEEKYRALVETSPDVIVVTDLHGTIQTVDQQALDLFGYTRKSGLVGKNFLTLIVPEDREKMQDAFRTLAQRKDIRNLEFRTVTREGTPVPVEVHASPLRDGDGVLWGAISVIRDVRERKEIERAKTEFLQLATHQLRTPLGVMRWSVELLLEQQERRDAAAAVDSARRIHANVLRLIALVNDLLDVSRIEQGRVRERRQRFDPRAIIEDVVKELEPLANHARVRVRVSRQTETMPAVIADPQLFHEVITNLLSNAVKYNNPGGEVDIRVESARGRVRIRVQDTGIGISQYEAKHLYSKFFRGDRAVLKSREGTGLGLFVVKSHVERWGGRVWFESQEGQGTTFFVELPLATG